MRNKELGYDLSFDKSSENMLKHVNQKSSERRFLTVDEGGKLLKELEGHGRLFVKTALLNGVRSGELAALR